MLSNRDNSTYFDLCLSVSKACNRILDIIDRDAALPEIMKLIDLELTFMEACVTKMRKTTTDIDKRFP